MVYDGKWVTNVKYINDEDDNLCIPFLLVPSIKDSIWGSVIGPNNCRIERKCLGGTLQSLLVQTLESTLYEYEVRLK